MNKGIRSISETTLKSKTPIGLSELASHWKEKALQLWLQHFLR